MTIGQTPKIENRLIAYSTMKKVENDIVEHDNITKHQTFKLAEIKYLLNGKNDADLEELRKKHLDYCSAPYRVYALERKTAKDVLKAKIYNSQLKINQLEQKYVNQINTLEQNRKKQNNNGSEIAERDAKTTMTKLKNEIAKYQELADLFHNPEFIGDEKIWEIEERYRIIEYIREKNETKTSPQEELKKIEEFKKIEEELKNISPDSNKKEENNYA